MPVIRRDKSSPDRGALVYFICILFLSNMLVYQWSSTDTSLSGSLLSLPSMANQDTVQHVFDHPLEIPRGQAKALPSVRVAEAIDRRIGGGKDTYGGSGDKPHLGGFTDIDTQGISPWAWRWMVQRLNIKSVLDVGCGRGISTTWFLFHGLDILCVEGSSDAREKTMLPDPDTQMVLHDFSRGPWWPVRTFDAVWCVEFLEHVGRNFHKNYLPAFRKAGLIFVTHSINGGWHHVEVHRGDWWKTKMEFYGFRYLEDLTMEIRTLVWNETHSPVKGVAPNGKPIGAPHIHANMQIFLNPLVTALPEHAHLVYEPGCFVSRAQGVLYQRDCDVGPEGEKETPLPDEFKPLILTKEQDDRWFEWVKARVKPWTRESK